jgi:hypothetical protein
MTMAMQCNLLLIHHSLELTIVELLEAFECNLELEGVPKIRRVVENDLGVWGRRDFCATRREA